MITASLRMVVPGRRKDEVIRAMRSLKGPTSAQPGCVDCRILEDADDAGVVLYVEEWGSREQLERHIRSEPYRRLLSIMEMAAERPEIRYDTVSQRQGFELVEAIRSPALGLARR